MAGYSADDWLERFKKTINTAIRETVGTFFANPRQFHGDTGIRHYLYHRVLTHGENAVHWKRKHQSGLLFQSEHYTALGYRQHGSKEKSGRFAFAWVDPSRVPENGDVRKAPALAVVEVGRNQNLAKMGGFKASKAAKNVRSGDAAKVIREMRFCGLPLGYLLELYDNPQRTVFAPQVFEAVAEAADDVRLQGFHLLVGMRRADSTLRVAVYPPPWRHDLKIEYPGLSPRST